jgi:hypothetical protein
LVYRGGWYLSPGARTCTYMPIPRVLIEHAREGRRSAEGSPRTMVASDNKAVRPAIERVIHGIYTSDPQIPPQLGAVRATPEDSLAIDLHHFPAVGAVLSTTDWSGL